MSVVFQRVPPRGHLDPATISRRVSTRLRAFFAPCGSGHRKRHHLGVIVLPASEQEAAEFLRRCAAKLSHHGASPDELPALLHRLGARLACETVEAAHNEEARAKAKDLLLTLALARGGRRRR